MWFSSKFVCTAAGAVQEIGPHPNRLFCFTFFTGRAPLTRRRARTIRPGGLALTTAIKTTAIFPRPFELPSFDETLPAGEYEIEAELLDPVDWIAPGRWAASVLVRLHPRASHPGLSRTLTVLLTELERAIAKDKFTGEVLTDFFLEEMLADPMIRLVMQADGVSEAEVRGAYSGRARALSREDVSARVVGSIVTTEVRDRMSPQPGSPRPGIGE